MAALTPFRDKIKGCGKLKVVGTLEGTELEIYGNLTINGYLYVPSPLNSMSLGGVVMNRC